MRFKLQIQIFVLQTLGDGPPKVAHRGVDPQTQNLHLRHLFKNFQHQEHMRGPQGQPQAQTVPHLPQRARGGQLAAAHRGPQRQPPDVRVLRRHPQEQVVSADALALLAQQVDVSVRGVRQSVQKEGVAGFPPEERARCVSGPC